MFRAVVALTLFTWLAPMSGPVFAQPKNLELKAKADPKAPSSKLDPKAASDKPETKIMLEKKEIKEPAPPKTPEPKERLPLGKWKLPPGAVVVLVEEIQEALALLPPKLVLLSAEEYQKLVDRLAKLESQLKAEKGIVASCKMTGKVEGEHLLLKAAITFVTLQARTPVLLGFSGAQLSDEADLDKQVLWLEATEEGFVARAEKEGVHQAHLVLKVPLQGRSLPTFVGGPERGFELNLPGSAVTTLTLDLHEKIQEIRVNDQKEKKQATGRFDLSLGKAKQALVSWKEPVAVAGTGPLLTADSQISVRLEDNQALIRADMTLEDLRGQAKEWLIQTPAKAQVEVKSPRGLSVEIVPADEKSPWTRIRLPEPTSEKVVLHIEAHAARPFPENRLAVGPFLVSGAYRHQGAVTILATPESLRGQRMVFHRRGETYVRESTKIAGPPDQVAMFQFWNLGTPSSKDKTSIGVPLEVDFKTDKGKLECWTDHVLRLKQQSNGWHLESITRFRMKAAHAGAEEVEIEMPRPRMPALEGLVLPAALGNNPGSWPWGIFLGHGLQDPTPWPMEFFWEEENGPPPQWQHLPGQRARIKLSRPQAKDFTLVLIGRYWLEPGASRTAIDLPRPLGMFERGSKFALAIDEAWELFVGKIGAEAPVSAKHQYQESWDRAAPRLSFSWKPYQTPKPATSMADISLHDGLARVRQQLTVTVPKRTGKVAGDGSHIRFRLPADARQIKVSGGDWRQDGDIGWILPQAEGPGKADLVFEYNVNWLGAEAVGNPSTSIPLFWPEDATDRQAKIRIWGSGRHWPVLDADASGQVWTRLGTEVVPDKESLPALVLAGNGDVVSMRASSGDTANARLAGWLCDRGLIQVTVDDEGGHHYRARFFVRKWSAPYLDLELPLPVLQGLQGVVITHKDAVKELPWIALDGSLTVARIPIDPAQYAESFLLELKYHLPASLAQTKRFWQTAFYPPLFKGEALPQRLRWQFSLSSSGVVFPLEKEVAVDFRWGWQGWLLAPEPSVSGEDLEEWLTQRDVPDSGDSVSLALWRSGPGTLTLLHFPRQFWLLLCSGMLLTAALVLYVVPWPRWFCWLIIVLLAAAALAAGLFWPGWAPSLFLGLQPGLVVVIVLAGIHWVLRARYRRQLVFLPGFTRVQSGSSLTRSSANRPAIVTPVVVTTPSAADAALVGSEPKK